MYPDGEWLFRMQFQLRVRIIGEVHVIYHNAARRVNHEVSAEDGRPNNSSNDDLKDITREEFIGE